MTDAEMLRGLNGDIIHCPTRREHYIFGWLETTLACDVCGNPVTNYKFWWKHD